MTKAELRKRYLHLRSSFSEAELSYLNHKLYESFFSTIDLSSIKVLHIFLPIKENHEPDTWAIIDRIQKEFPSTRLSIPKVCADESLENYYFEGLQQLEYNSWHIPEPRWGILTETHQIDMVIVPLLIFDEQGHRVGYGKGFYDRFLAQCRADCKKVGLSFFEPVEHISDVEGHDQRLNLVLTPKEIFNFL